MIKTIVVPSTGHDADTPAFAVAATVAQLFGAHIDAVHVKIDPVEVAVAMSTEGAGGTLLQGIIDDLTQEADEAEAAAQATFTQFFTKAEVSLAPNAGERPSQASAQFHVETGQAAAWLTTYGLTSDLTIASRGLADRAAAQRSILEALLLETGRPLLIPGPAVPTRDFADCVTVAWKPVPQAARAVATAMPFLAHAREVCIVTVDEDGDARDRAQPLVDYLGWHGIKATVERLSPGAEGASATMLKAASAKGGLLVMGGYGHTRLREWVFGGFTQLVLEGAQIPVLMAH